MTVQYHLGKFPPLEMDWPKLIPHIRPASAAVARYDGTLSAIPNAPPSMKFNFTNLYCLTIPISTEGSYAALLFNYCLGSKVQVQNIKRGRCNGSE